MTFSFFAFTLLSILESTADNFLIPVEILLFHISPVTSACCLPQAQTSDCEAPDAGGQPNLLLPFLFELLGSLESVFLDAAPACVR